MVILLIYYKGTKFKPIIKSGFVMPWHTTAGGMALLPMLTEGECFLRPPIMSGSVCPPESGQSSLKVEIIFFFYY